MPVAKNNSKTNDITPNDKLTPKQLAYIKDQLSEHDTSYIAQLIPQLKSLIESSAKDVEVSVNNIVEAMSAVYKLRLDGTAEEAANKLTAKMAHLTPAEMDIALNYFNYDFVVAKMTANGARGNWYSNPLRMAGVFVTLTCLSVAWALTPIRQSIYDVAQIEVERSVPACRKGLGVDSQDKLMCARLVEREFSDRWNNYLFNKSNY